MEKPVVGISMNTEELCDKVSKNSGVSKIDVKKILDSFLEVFFKKLKMK